MNEVNACTRAMNSAASQQQQQSVEQASSSTTTTTTTPPQQQSATSATRESPCHSFSQEPNPSSSKKPLPGFAQQKLKAISQRTVPLLNELKCLVPAGSAQQQALQQQALHQAALHQQALKHHHGLQTITTHSQQQQVSHPQGNIKNPQHAASTCLAPQALVTMDRQVAKVEPMEVDRLSSYSGQHQGVVDSSTRTGTDGEGLLMPRDGSFADLNSEPPANESKHSAPTDRAPHNVECSRLTLEEQAQRLKQAKDHSFLKDGPADGCKKSVKSGKVRPKLKGIESGVDGEMDLQFSGALATREENIKGLKAGLIHVAHKMPKNAHAHFVLGLMYQRLGQPAKAASTFQKAGEILKKAEEELGQNRGQLLAAVRCHYAVSMLQASIVGKVCLGSELQSSEIESWMKNLKVAVQTDPGHFLVWNTLGLVLLQTGQIQSAISIFRSLLYMVPDCLDALANLGVAYLHSGHLADASRCLQLLLEKDTSHPGALLNYGTLLLCQYGSTFAGAGAGAGDGAYESQNVAATTAQQCLTAALKVDPKAGHLWANLAAAYTVLCDFCSARKCLEQASKLEPNRLSTRYAIAMHRVRDSQLSHDASEQLSWAANEMASILRESYSLTIQPVIAWAGLAMVNRAQHETVAAFEGDEVDYRESKARAFHTLKQAIEENPNDAMQWHQLGLYTLCTLQFRLAQSYLKTAIAHRQSCGAAWSNLGIALQLSDDPSLAEEVYQKALSLVSQEQAHSIFSNLGNLYRQQKRFTDAHEAFKKALELCPNYAPACNNLGLLLIAEGKLDEAIRMFDRALLSDSLLDAAKSNKMKAEALAQIREHKHSFHLTSNGKLAASESSLHGCTHSESGNT